MYCSFIFVKMFPLKKFKGGLPSNIIYTVLLLAFFSSCQPVDVFEKNISIPNFAWTSDFKPEITFDITDTTSRYTIYIVLRHSDAYRFKNIWVNVHMKIPSGATRTQPLELKLATDDKGWLGSGMDDIYEHRIPITPPQKPEPLSAGTYTFRLENIMREDPLRNVMNIGIRLEKAPK
jgi:gliding motility-associated lipoprotein GldH